MNVLARKISQKAESIISNIYETLPKPIEYYPLNNQVGCFGRCGQNNYCYLVWLDDTLPDNEFETNLLHELIHLTQMVKNIPDARPINDNAEGELQFAQSINSIIFDIEVERKLKVYDFDSRYFSNIRLKQMRDIRNKGFKNYANNDFMQKYSAIRLALHAYIATGEIAEKMYGIFMKRYPNICTMAKKITHIIEGKLFEETDEMFEVMKKIIEILIIGEHVKIAYKENVFFYDNNSWSNLRSASDNFV